MSEEEIFGLVKAPLITTVQLINDNRRNWGGFNSALKNLKFSVENSLITSLKNSGCMDNIVCALKEYENSLAGSDVHFQGNTQAFLNQISILTKTYKNLEKTGEKCLEANMKHEAWDCFKKAAKLSKDPWYWQKVGIIFYRYGYKKEVKMCFEIMTETCWKAFCNKKTDELFILENLSHVSCLNGVVGSIYFQDKKGKSGRILLNHWKSGPKLEKDEYTLEIFSNIDHNASRPDKYSSKDMEDVRSFLARHGWSRPAKKGEYLYEIFVKDNVWVGSHLSRGKKETPVGFTQEAINVLYHSVATKINNPWMYCLRNYTSMPSQLEMDLVDYKRQMTGIH